MALVHFISSALGSILVFSGATVRPAEFIVDVYGAFISLLLGLGITSLVYFLGQELALFFGLPIIMWFSIGFFSGLTEFFYYQRYRHTGVDVLETGEALSEEEENEEFKSN